MARASAARRAAVAAALAAALASAAVAARAQDASPSSGVREMIRQRNLADSTRAAGSPPVATPPRTGAGGAPASAATLADTSLGDFGRVPGMPLRFGDGYARVRRSPGLAPGDPSQTGPGEALLTGRMRFYGVEGDVQLRFDERGLGSVAWKARPISPNQRDYVEDQLRREGARARCMRYDDRLRECDWVGAVTVHVKSDTSGMTAESVRPGAAPTRALVLLTDTQRDSIAEAQRVAPFLADPTPILADTLTIDPAATPGRRSPPVLQQAFPADYPDALLERGITGIVRVLALVGTNGRVAYANPTDGPPELRPYARDTVMKFRFNGYQDGGKPVRFWVWVPVRFGV